MRHYKIGESKVNFFLFARTKNIFNPENIYVHFCGTNRYFYHLICCRKNELMCADQKNERELKISSVSILLCLNNNGMSIGNKCVVVGQALFKLCHQI